MDCGILGIVVLFLLQFPVSGKIVDAKKHHFVLVHGAGHGAWCWYKIANALQQSGHQVDTLDLVSAGTSSVDATTVGSVERYSAPLIQMLESVNDTVILVGHSSGGITLTYALEKMPSRISKAVYLAAFMFSHNATRAREIFNQPGTPGSLTLIFSNGSTVPSAAAFKLDRAQQVLYKKSPSQDVVLAKSLLKPFPLFDVAVNFTSANYGHVPRYFIKTLQDRTILRARQEQMIYENPPLQVLTLDSDHSPFFSTPLALVKLLLSLA
ncbi:putative methylesterase 11, chloroplastic [Selaginella moellendorffii]|uniref:putative methylesterase 11, chloroplastic n=1 Tax=Selaginella moellendorffii TaxID=88036 RepID=UPI000D1C97D9|nr:putative methylesterase 11, chloroplastic [Selaginella moellendorffii]|eukprot:XP_024540765.1 putative methylesterase 11, chloroplastic [Selaginella moellendorffii]